MVSGVQWRHRVGVLTTWIRSHIRNIWDLYIFCIASPFTGRCFISNFPLMVRQPTLRSLLAFDHVTDGLAFPPGVVALSAPRNPAEVHTQRHLWIVYPSPPRNFVSQGEPTHGGRGSSQPALFSPASSSQLDCTPPTKGIHWNKVRAAAAELSRKYWCSAKKYGQEWRLSGFLVVLPQNVGWKIPKWLHFVFVFVLGIWVQPSIRHYF